MSFFLMLAGFFALLHLPFFRRLNYLQRRRAKGAVALVWDGAEVRVLAPGGTVPKGARPRLRAARAELLQAMMGADERPADDLQALAAVAVAGVGQGT